MELLLAERFVLISLLPNEEDYVTMKELFRLRMDLMPDAEEIQKFNMRTENGMLVIDPKLEKEAEVYSKDIPINSWGIQFIQDIIRKENDKHKLNHVKVSLYEKFIVAYDQV